MPRFSTDAALYPNLSPAQHLSVLSLANFWVAGLVLIHSKKFSSVFGAHLVNSPPRKDEGSYT
jgi:hypothetical protein